MGNKNFKGTGNNLSCNKAICVLNSEKSDFKGKGIVLFSQEGNKCRITFHFSGLEPYSTHAIHIHEYGDLSRGCESLGAHWNPSGETHGSLAVPERSRHAGDLINNISGNFQGVFNYSYYDDKVKVKDIIGRSVVVHEGEDDLGLGGNSESLKTGNAGGRMMCGVIGRMKDD